MKKRFFGGLFLTVLVFSGSFGVSNIQNAKAENPYDVNRASNNYGQVKGTVSEIVGMAVKAPLTWSTAAKNPVNFLTGRADLEGVGFSVLFVNMSNNLLHWAVSEELYNDVFFSDVARAGIIKTWEVVRGLVNMFYLLILLFLAITTILRVNKFSDKKLFFNVIISAVLVNFSLVITLVVIDFSNLIMTYFASAISNVSLANSFFDTASLAGVKSSPSIILKVGMSTVEFIINIIMGVMLLFTAVALLIRLIAYWVLMILSPLAFFAIAIPGSSGFNEWKDKLVYYSFFGPIMLFFIWLAVTLSYYLHEAFINSEGNIKDNTMTVFLVGYITVIYLLYYGHDKSKAMAGKAGDFTGKIMNKGGEWATKAGKGAAMATPLGAGYLLSQYGKSKVSSEYSGIKRSMQDGKYGKIGTLLTEKGRKEAQETQDFNAQIRHAATPEKKAQLTRKRAMTSYAKDKEDGVNVENDKMWEEVLLNKTTSNADKEKAAYALETLNKLGMSTDSKGNEVNRLTEVLKVWGEKNEVSKNAAFASAGKNNKVALTNHHAAEYNNNVDSAKYIDANIKKYEHILGASVTALPVARQSASQRESLATKGLFVNMTASDKAAMVNENDSTAIKAAREIKNYHFSVGGKDALSKKEKDIMREKISSTAAKTELRPTLV